MLKYNNRFKRNSADQHQIYQCTSDIKSLQSDLKSMASVLEMAGNINRLKILFLIHQEEEMCPSDLGQILEMTIPAISQHLKKLKAKGILTDRQSRQTIYYSINEDEAGLLMPILNRLVAKNY